MISTYKTDRKAFVPKSWGIPKPKVNLAAPPPSVRMMKRSQISRHSSQLPLEEGRKQTLVIVERKAAPPQQMAGRVCRFFSKIKELIIWSWSYLWALWFLLVIAVVYYLRGPLKITDNIGMGKFSRTS